MKAHESDPARGPMVHRSARDYIQRFSARLYARGSTLGNLLVEGICRHVEIMSFSGLETNPFYFAVGASRFENLTGPAGLAFREDSRALAAADLDRDGDLDIVLRNAFTNPVVLLRNDRGTERRAITVRLRSRDCPPFGIGAVVRAAAQVRPIVCGSSYLTCEPPEAHFGLGPATEARVEILWPCGRRQVLADVPAGAILDIEEGADQPARAPYRPALPPPPPAHPRTIRPGDRLAWELTSFSGRRRTVPDGKPALLYVFSTKMLAWTTDQSHVANLALQLAMQGAELVALNVDTDTAAAREALATMPMVETCDARHLRDRLLAPGRPLVPVGLWIDAEGVVRARRVGALGEDWVAWAQQCASGGAGRGR